MTKEELIAYITARQYTVIATFGDEFPESACIEYGNDGLTLIFDTNRGSRKFANIQKNSKVSLVIGWEDERTVQYEGIATLLEEGSEELDRLKKAYFKKKSRSAKVGKH